MRELGKLFSVVVTALVMTVGCVGTQGSGLDPTSSASSGEAGVTTGAGNCGVGGHQTSAVVGVGVGGHQGSVVAVAVVSSSVVGVGGFGSAVTTTATGFGGFDTGTSVTGAGGAEEGTTAVTVTVTGAGGAETGTTGAGGSSAVGGGFMF